MKTDVQKIIDILTHTYEKNAWHGPSVKEVIAMLSPQHASLRIGSSHSIEELIRHMTAWRVYVIKKLEGDEFYEVKDDVNFPEEQDLPEACKQLDESQEQLLQALRNTPEEKLREKVPGRPFTYFTMLHGIIHHDLYHAGQIMLLLKSTAAK